MEMAAPHPNRRGSTTHDDDWHWVGHPMSATERAERYPDRYVSEETLQGYQAPNHDQPAALVR